jgi:hypothetical protein
MTGVVGLPNALNRFWEISWRGRVVDKSGGLKVERSKLHRLRTPLRSRVRLGSLLTAPDGLCVVRQTQGEIKGQTILRQPCGKASHETSLVVLVDASCSKRICSILPEPTWTTFTMTEPQRTVIQPLSLFFFRALPGVIVWALWGSSITEWSKWPSPHRTIRA